MALNKEKRNKETQWNDAKKKNDMNKRLKTEKKQERKIETRKPTKGNEWKKERTKHR